MNSKHAFLVLSTFTLVSIAYGEREVFAPTKLAPTATAANGNITFSNVAPFWTGANIYSTSNFGIGPTTANVLSFHSNGAERMRINSTGNVFVGNGETVASPAAGNIRATGGSGTNINGADLVLHGGQSTGTAGGGGLRFFTAPAGGVSGTSVNASIERMQIDSAGDIFVGNGRSSGSPASASIRGTAASGTNVAAQDLTLAPGQGTGTGAGGALRILTAAAGTSGSSVNSLTERMRIDSSGNVGIGTNNPAYKLDVVSPVGTGTSVRIDGDASVGSSSLRLADRGTERLSVFASTSNAFIIANANANGLILSAQKAGGSILGLTGTSQTERFRITDGADVVFGNGDTSATPANATIRGTNASGTDIGGPNLTIQAGRGTGTGAGGAVVFQTSAAGTTGSTLNAATERMRIDSSGNVGIGTTTNLSTLTINGPIAPKGPTDVNAATYTVATTDSSLRFTTTNCTVTLPAAASFPGRILWLNTVTANSVTSNASNVIPLGSNTAGTAIFAATAGKFAMIQSNGTNWVTMMSN